MHSFLEAPQQELKLDVTKDSPVSRNVDIDKLAKAVAWHETHDGELGYGKMYNNAFGIKNGSIAPCKRIGKNSMCIYNTKEESYEAFKKIWLEGYGDRFPTIEDARAYSGNDRAETWLYNVRLKYNS